MTDEWEQWKYAKTKHRADSDEGKVTTMDLLVYDRHMKQYLTDAFNGFAKHLEGIVNTEIERVCRDQDERCITELCKIMDEKLEEFLEQLDE